MGKILNSEKNCHVSSLSFMLIHALNYIDYLSLELSELWCGECLLLVAVQWTLDCTSVPYTTARMAPPACCTGLVLPGCTRECLFH